jgi:hypothetical protein
MTTTPISQQVAHELLSVTSANTTGGRIGSPHDARGYSLEEALAVVERARRVVPGVWYGNEVLQIDTPHYGEHVFYLRLDGPVTDPWA